MENRGSSIYLDLAFVCKTLSASPDSRNFKEGEALLNAKHLIVCESSAKTATSIDIYALCLQTSAMNSPPHCIEGTFEIQECKVIEAHGFKCSCKAGASARCKHVAAVLLFCSRNNIGEFHILSQTDKKCAWSNKKGPALAQYSPMPLKETECFKTVQNRSLLNVNNEEVAQMLMDACPNSAITKHRKGRISLDSQPQRLPEHNLLDESEIVIGEQLLSEAEFVSRYFSEEDNKWMKFLSELDVTPLHECCRNFYNSTIICEDHVQLCVKTHFNRTLWCKERQFRITGSRCYEIYTYQQDNWPSKASKYFWPKKYKKIDNLEHGLAHETPAREVYRALLSEEEDIIETGLILSKNNSWLGYTPDGIVTKNGKPYKLLEIKCIVKGKELTASEAIKTCKFVEFKNGIYTIKVRNKYYGQVQLGMALLNLKQTDFIIYASVDKSIVNITVPFDEIFVKKLLTKLKVNFFNQMLHNVCINLV